MRLIPIRAACIKYRSGDPSGNPPFPSGNLHAFRILGLQSKSSATSSKKIPEQKSLALTFAPRNTKHMNKASDWPSGTSYFSFRGSSGTAAFWYVLEHLTF